MPLANFCTQHQRIALAIAMIVASLSSSDHLDPNCGTNGESPKLWSRAGCATSTSGDFFDQDILYFVQSLSRTARTVCCVVVVRSTKVSGKVQIRTCVGSVVSYVQMTHARYAHTLRTHIKQELVGCVVPQFINHGTRLAYAGSTRCAVTSREIISDGSTEMQSSGRHPVPFIDATTSGSFACIPAGFTSSFHTWRKHFKFSLRVCFV